MKFIGLSSVVVNIMLILVILIRSPNEQSLQENLDPFNIFESSSKAEKTIDTAIQILTILYFFIALFYSIKGYF